MAEPKGMFTATLNDSMRSILHTMAVSGMDHMVMKLQGLDVHLTLVQTPVSDQLAEVIGNFLKTTQQPTGR